jgi:hypothetical protein
VQISRRRLSSLDGHFASEVEDTEVQDNNCSLEKDLWDLDLKFKLVESQEVHHRAIRLLNKVHSFGLMEKCMSASSKTRRVHHLLGHKQCKNLACQDVLSHSSHEQQHEEAEPVLHVSDASNSHGSRLQIIHGSIEAVKQTFTAALPPLMPLLEVLLQVFKSENQHDVNLDLPSDQMAEGYEWWHQSSDMRAFHNSLKSNSREGRSARQLLTTSSNCSSQQFVVPNTTNSGTQSGTIVSAQVPGSICITSSVSVQELLMSMVLGTLTDVINSQNAVKVSGKCSTNIKMNPAQILTMKTLNMLRFMSHK